MALFDYYSLRAGFRCRVEQNIGLDQLCPFKPRRASDTHNCNNRLLSMRPPGVIQPQLDRPLYLETSTPARRFTAKTSEFDNPSRRRALRPDLASVTAGRLRPDGARPRSVSAAQCQRPVPGSGR